MIKRQKYNPVGWAEMKLGVMHPLSGFMWVPSCNRAVLRRRRSRVVSRAGIRGLRWFNRTGSARKAHGLKLDKNWPLMARKARRLAPLRMRNHKNYRLY